MDNRGNQAAREPDAYFVPDLARAKGVSSDRIYRLIKEGLLEATRISPRRTVVRAEAWERLTGKNCGS
jgi:hypothetical protein